MRIALFGTQFSRSAGWRVAPVLLALLLSMTAWTGRAEAAFACASNAAVAQLAAANFICSSNADCAETAIGCGAECFDGICDPGNPDSDNIGCIVVPNDAKCDDGDFCNGAEFCKNNGACEDALPPTCDDQLPCTLDSCDSQTNACSHVPRNSLCNDGLFCDGQEICDPTDGCIDGTPPRCGDGIACTVDSCSEETDSCIHSPNNAACSDGVFCDGAEVCNVFEGCVEAARPACDDGYACTADTCNEANDTCGHTANNALCDNGLFCDGAETCSLSRGCVAGTAPNCADAVACTTDACNEATDSCTHAANNAACSNGVFCDGAETCNVTLGCQAATPVNCADNFSCTVDSCNEAADRCDHATNDAVCNNGLYCDGVESCSASQGCVAGTAPNCADTVSCTVDTCVEATDSCAHTTSNALCSNGLFCDGAEICHPLRGCEAGTPPNCTDKFACTGDSCNEATDSCQFTPHDSACSNGVFCDGVEVCTVGKGCQAGAPPCSDGVACTSDTCNESNDSCRNVAIDTLCSNGKFCDGVETCNAKLGCQAGTPVNCADDVECTVDTCMEATDTCSHVESNARCSDGLFCNGAERCDILIGCYDGPQPACSDNVDCTVDACVEETDSCSHSASNDLCTNGLFCDGTETCDAALGCQDGPAPDCVDDIECTVDSCSEAGKSCVNAPDNSACSNGLFCDGSEVCNPAAGCQAGSPPNCADALTCTDDSCFENADMCLNVPNFSLCGNGVVDAACSEECDQDNGEVCNNDIDDDGDLLIDCADPDCEQKTEPTCDENCQLVPPCRILLRDPAVISWGASESRAADRPGYFYFHARLIPTTPIDPKAEGFVVTLANANGVIYRADVKPIDIRSSQRRFVYIAPDPAAVARTGGIVRLSVVRRTSEGEVGYGFRVKAIGDFSAATLAKMTTQVYFGDDVGYVTAEWSGEPGRWVLRQRDYDDGRP